MKYPGREAPPELRLTEIGRVTDSDEADRRILGLLREYGADLTQPRSVRHYLLWSNWFAAIRGGRQLRALGFSTTRGRMPDDGTWWVRADHVAVIDLLAIRELHGRLCALAGPLGGHYDGKEAAPEP